MISELHMWLTFGVIAGAMLLYVYRNCGDRDDLAIGAGRHAAPVHALSPNRAGRHKPSGRDGAFGRLRQPGTHHGHGIIGDGARAVQSGALENLIDRATRRATRRRYSHLGHVDRRHACQRLAQQHASGLMAIPIIVAIAKRAKLNPARHMMPLSFMTILGGMLTLIGSSTNLLVADAAARFTDHSLGFFQQTPIAIILISVGTLYIFFIMPRIIGETEVEEKSDSAETGRQYIIELRLRIGDALGANTAPVFCLH